MSSIGAPCLKDLKRLNLSWHLPLSPWPRQLLERYNSPDVDRVSSMMAKVQHINENLMESIDKILERQEKIELLVSRSQVLSDSASSFRRDAEQLRRLVWWGNVKKMGMAAGCLLLIILVIVVSSCGITFSHC